MAPSILTAVEQKIQILHRKSALGVARINVLRITARPASIELPGRPVQLGHRDRVRTTSAEESPSVNTRSSTPLR